MGKLIGFFHPTTSNDPLYFGQEFREDEIPQIIEGFTYKPVCYEHDSSIVVGYARKIFSNSSNQLLCEIEIFSNWDKTIQQLIDEENVLGLSLKYNYKRFNHIHYSFRPLEISLVQKGKLEDTWLIAYENGENRRLFTKGIQMILGTNHNLKMENQTQPPIRDVNAELEDQLQKLKKEHEDVLGKYQKLKAEMESQEEKEVKAFSEKFNKDILPYLQDNIQEQTTRDQLIEAIAEISKNPAGRQVLAFSAGEFVAKKNEIARVVELQKQNQELQQKLAKVPEYELTSMNERKRMKADESTPPKPVVENPVSWLQQQILAQKSSNKPHVPVKLPTQSN